MHQSCPCNINDKAMMEAFSTMLDGISSDNISILKTLKKKYQLYLLSNTNSIHMQSILAAAQEKHGINLLDCFDQVFLSYEIGLRKPNPAIFNYVLDTISQKPQHGLFIDDLKENVNSAQTTGLNTLHYPHNQPLRQGCKNLL